MCNISLKIEFKGYISVKWLSGRAAPCRHKKALIESQGLFVSASRYTHKFNIGAYVADRQAQQGNGTAITVTKYYKQNSLAKA